MPSRSTDAAGIAAFAGARTQIATKTAVPNHSRSTWLLTSLLSAIGLYTPLRRRKTARSRLPKLVYTKIIPTTASCYPKRINTPVIVKIASGFLAGRRGPCGRFTAAGETIDTWIARSTGGPTATLADRSHGAWFPAGCDAASLIAAAPTIVRSGS
jgi:hypothetical protein